ncbi:MAG: DUF2378 family protein [Myxococcaceae bacterium]|nr:DUF2378 family protein [Myxococcaceae bacterium]
MTPNLTPPSPAAVRVARSVQPPDLTISDLADRLRFANDDDTCKGMFFNGVLLASEKLLGPSSRERVAAMMPEKKYVDFFNYPIATFLPAAFQASKLLMPTHGTFDASIRKLGEQAIDDFLATAVGRTLVTVSAGEPKRLMRAAPVAYKTAVSYGSRETVVTGEKTCVFKMRRDFMPHAYHEGVFTAVLRALGCHDVQVHGRRLGLFDADYDVSWR